MSRKTQIIPHHPDQALRSFSTGRVPEYQPSTVAPSPKASRTEYDFQVSATMEQRSINGQENPISVIDANKLWEEQKYLTLTNQQTTAIGDFSKKVSGSLTKTERKIIIDSADEAVKAQSHATLTRFTIQLGGRLSVN